MKKIISIIIIFIMFFALWTMVNRVYASVTIEQVVDNFNKCKMIEDFKKYNGDVKAEFNNSNIIIDVFMQGEKIEVKYPVDGNIIFIEGDTTNEYDFLKVYMGAVLIECIGQLHGYEAGELTKTVNSEKVEKYTLENEGYKVEKISDTEVKIKIDVSKKIPLVDFSDVYIKVEDLDFLKEYIYGNGSAETSKGNVWFNKSGSNGEYTLLIAEKNKLTENTYKSLLSIIEVMFSDKMNINAVEYFKLNYSDISKGDIVFKGFDIKVNPKDKTDWEETLIPSNSGYEFMRIIIDKQLVVSTLNGGNEDIKTEDDMKEETEDLKQPSVSDTTIQNGKIFYNYDIAKAMGLLRENQRNSGYYNPNITKYPNAGLEENKLVPIIEITIGMLFAALVLMILKVKKIKKD